MRYVISYDISNDRRRQRIAKILQNYGWRVQESVFEVCLDDGLRRRLERQLESAWEAEEEGSIRIYPCCKTCLDGTSGVGNLIDVPADAKNWIF